MQLIINALVAIFGASVGAYLGYYYAKKMDKENQKKIYKNLLVGLLAEFESNKACVIRCKADIISPEEFHRESAPISFEVFKEFQTNSTTYDNISDLLLKELVDFTSQLRKFKATGYNNDHTSEAKINAQISKINKEISRVDELLQADDV